MSYCIPIWHLICLRYINWILFIPMGANYSRWVQIDVSVCKRWCVGTIQKASQVYTLFPVWNLISQFLEHQTNMPFYTNLGSSIKTAPFASNRSSNNLSAILGKYSFMISSHTHNSNRFLVVQVFVWFLFKYLCGFYSSVCLFFIQVFVWFLFKCLVIIIFQMIRLQSYCHNCYKRNSEVFLKWTYARNPLNFKPFNMLLSVTLDINTSISTSVKTTLMITLHQEIGLHTRCRTKNSKENVV